MIRPDQIPDEAVEAAAIAIYISVYPAPDYFSWAERPEHTRRIYINHARAAIAAGLGAWPGAHPVTDIGYHLPLPTEASD